MNERFKLYMMMAAVSLASSLTACSGRQADTGTPDASMFVRVEGPDLITPDGSKL